MMKRTTVWGRIAALVFLVAFAFACSSGIATEAGAEPEKTPSKADIEALIANLDSSIKVVSIEPSEVEGLVQVIVIARGEPGILYVDSSMKYLVVGSLIDAKTQANITKAKFESIKDQYQPKVDFSSIPLEDAVVMGDPKAKHKVVVYDDPD